MILNTASATDRAVYLDHAATTPVLPEVIDVMSAELARNGNASSLHTAGRDARRRLEEAREELAGALAARPSEVIFTAGATEANNLAIKGLYWARSERRRILISAIEHHAIFDPTQWLAEAEGAQLVPIPVDENGFVNLTALAELIAEDPDDIALIAVMWANNEMGAVQPISEVVALAQPHGIPVHCDAVQAIGQVPVDFAASGVDTMSISGHKIGGPPGVGALLATREAKLTPVLHGGGQERGVRSGTLDVPGSRALATAVRLAVQNQPAEAQRLMRLRDRLAQGIQELTDAVVRGPELASQDRDNLTRLPANLHLTFPGCEGDSLLYLLDSQGVQVSTGSACQAGVPQPSHVLLAMGLAENVARGALRFSLGHTSTDADVDTVLAVLPEVVERARAAGLAGGIA